MLGLDTHADISCAGRDAWILAQVEGRTYSVYPFDESYKAMTGINIVNVTYKYENDEGGQFMLEVNQCLNFIDSMTHSILCTNKVRHSGVIVNDQRELFSNINSLSFMVYFSTHITVNVIVSETESKKFDTT